ncbi:MAG: CPBP family intramembrane metalloprotease [Caldilineaceae bacterium]|nr:CPBP family intramembrane metalloprotease [Caldilineaceae bacterium]
MIELLNLLLLFAPLFLIVGLANLAEGAREHEKPFQGLAIAGYLLLSLLYLAAILIGLSLETVLAALDTTFQPDSLSLLTAGLWIPGLVGILLLLPPVRRLLSYVTNIDPGSPVHAVALSLTMLVLVNLFVTLGIGLGNLAESLAAQGEAGAAATTTLGLWLQQIFTALLALVGVGWLTRRDWRQALQRLGIVKPTVRQLLIGFFLGLLMVPVIMVIEQLAGYYNIGMDENVSDLTEQLLGSVLTTPFGIFTIGAAAALGEETIFRGAIQPRFGLVLTALLFALVHSNYGLTLSTLIVFVVGMILGLLRKRYNTTTSMMMHATYNIALALLTTLGI